MDAEDKNADVPFRSELLKRLLQEADAPRGFEATYHLSDTKPQDLLGALGVPKDALSDREQATLAAIEELNDSDSSWLDFKWKVTALLHVQDVFDAILQAPEDDPHLWFEQYYFYYESRMLLAESFLCGLNGRYVAASAMLRPFLEFTVLQNYYYRRVQDAETYAPLQEYFGHGRRHPRWKQLLANALPDDAFCEPIKFRLFTHLAGLSESSVHPYHPDFSPVQHRTTTHGHSFQGLHFWQTTRMVLEAGLWAYYVNFPMLFQPVDIVRKFRYNGPVGVIADQHTGTAVKRSLPPAEYEAFKEYSSRQEKTAGVLQWVESRPDLTDEQIRATWQEKNRAFPGIVQAYCLTMAKLRALRNAMALRPSERTEAHDDLLLISLI